MTEVEGLSFLFDYRRAVLLVEISACGTGIELRINLIWDQIDRPQMGIKLKVL